MSGPFFVGGTGRCGTSQLCRVLGDHPEVHALEWQSRFLLELFPSATVVVIMRYPVHVVASHLDQPWAPSALDAVLDWLQPVYQRWLAQRPALLNDQRYVEVKAEELAANWPVSRRRLFARLSLPDADTPHAFSTSRLASRDGKLTEPEQREVLGRLRWAAEELGYQTTP